MKSSTVKKNYDLFQAPYVRIALTWLKKWNKSSLAFLQSIEPGQQFTWDHSNIEINKRKNRYANVIAYDHSRIVLEEIDGVLGSDYINANYCDGYRKHNAYIATQVRVWGRVGPKWVKNVTTFIWQKFELRPKLQVNAFSTPLTHSLKIIISGRRKISWAIWAARLGQLTWGKQGVCDTFWGHYILWCLELKD